ncbi:Gfo/Idh/MocA family oxidoreductase [Bartonella sp. HY329]|uniref:Gfo/Idh/MocA family protein n=1 Tax=unclassified Bartonella TaxID=2645622 RepID=UPI0021CAC1C8|nr:MULTISPECIES: Gfo/Idh/MocA family oxidoreductase [unclassified Bartonella]UXM94433.1 Gfo/Idh/MocA family oxidoreductase [Bartonella sp. HY329]UXN08757.1 Gfo/Idh/MocA family oxidoreductase [Bartonella sp. HY328]
MAEITQELHWGIIGAARIAENAILPALIKSPYAKPHAIASRNTARAKELASKFHIAKIYDSYDALLEDDDIDVVYIALPNNLHVEWMEKAIKANKHILCEKPAAMNYRSLEALKNDKIHLKISEAFMVRQQPRWIRLQEILASKIYGEVKTFSSLLSFMMSDDPDFRQDPKMGGGAYFDLGCYTAMAARFVFQKEPLRVMALMEKNAAGIDLFSTVILDFGDGCHASFLVSLASASSQSIQIVCEKAFINLPQAYVPSRQLPNLIQIDTSTDHANSKLEIIEFPALDQYEAEVTAFSQAVLGHDVPFYGLDDALANARIGDAIFKSANSGQWVNCNSFNDKL